MHLMVMFAQKLITHHLTICIIRGNLCSKFAIEKLQDEIHSRGKAINIYTHTDAMHKNKLASKKSYTRKW